MIGKNTKIASSFFAIIIGIALSASTACAMQHSELPASDAKKVPLVEEQKTRDPRDVVSVPRGASEDGNLTQEEILKKMGYTDAEMHAHIKSIPLDRYLKMPRETLMATYNDEELALLSLRYTYEPKQHEKILEASKSEELSEELPKEESKEEFKEPWNGSDDEWQK